MENNPDEEIPVFGCDGRSINEADDDSMSEAVYRWQQFSSPDDAYRGGYVWFAVLPHAVSYTRDTGFGAEPSDVPALISPQVEKKSVERVAYTADTFVEHITGLFYAYMRPVKTRKHNQMALRDEFLYPLGRICEQLGADPVLGEKMMRLTLALHDVGKLNRPWQSWVQAWQAAYAQHVASPTRPADGTPLAHTDFDPNDTRVRMLKQAFSHPARGTHAVESAEASLKMIAAACGGDTTWLAVTLAAIMRHHTPDALACGAFGMVPTGDDALAGALRACGFADETEISHWLTSINRKFSNSSHTLSKAVEHVTPATTKPGAVYRWLLYLLFVRTLRLADQRSTDALHQAK
jgi:hypothetical protein